MISLFIIVTIFNNKDVKNKYRLFFGHFKLLQSSVDSFKVLDFMLPLSILSRYLFLE